MTLVFIAYIPAAIKGVHDWGTVLHATVTPTFGGAVRQRDRGLPDRPGGHHDQPLHAVLRAVRRWWRRASRARDYRYTRVEVVVGSLFAILVAMFIIIATAAALYGHAGRQTGSPTPRPSPWR